MFVVKVISFPPRIWALPTEPHSVHWTHFTRESSTGHIWLCHRVPSPRHGRVPSWSGPQDVLSKEVGYGTHGSFHRVFMGPKVWIVFDVWSVFCNSSGVGFIVVWEKCWWLKVCQGCVYMHCVCAYMVTNIRIHTVTCCLSLSYYLKVTIVGQEQRRENASKKLL